MYPSSVSFRRWLVPAMAAGLITLAGASNGPDVEEVWDRPVVKVASPDRIAYEIGTDGSPNKIFITIEIVDASGVGIERDRSGLPRFLEPSQNVTSFLDRIVAKGTYTNKLGQEVLQLVSLIPVDKLKMSEERIRPPIDFKRLRPTEGERKLLIPAGDMLESAMFNFQVKDLRGVSSDRDAGTLTIGFGTGLWVPSQ